MVGHILAPRPVDDFLFFCVLRTHVPQLNACRAQLHPQLTSYQHNAHLYYGGPILPDQTPLQLDEDCYFPVKVFSGSLFSYNANDIDLLSNRLGLPWKQEKTTPFSDTITYLGFIWDLQLRKVSLHPTKQQKYLFTLHEW